MNSSGLKEEKLWIIGSVIVGFASSAYLYFHGDATKAEIFQIGFALSFLLWIITVVRRALKGDLGKGFVPTLIRIIIAFGVIAGIVSLALSSLGVIN